MNNPFLKLLVAGSIVAFGIVGCATKSQPAPAAAAPLKTYTVKGVNFALDSAKLDKSANAILDEAAAGIKAAPNTKWEVNGYTCTLGSRAHNQRLSERRAASVKDALVARGVSPAVLTARGFAWDNPVADNKTEAGRAENRRVEIRPVK
jgi:OOP family OmpA-OmpF porin